MSQPTTLRPETLPLTGCHLIEASAGTGKTFNITRLYLRLLLERKLDVKNILVMTFTRAATEELRGRIAKEIRNALDHWQAWCESPPEDDFFSTLVQQFSYQTVYPALHNALLHLDEASIFTIHGFCSRVLSQQAFSSGVAFNVKMEADTSDIELEAVRDWYRALAQDASHYGVLTRLWLTPDDFCKAFRSVFSSTIPVQVIQPEAIEQAFHEQKRDCLLALKKHETFVFTELISNHKKKDERTEEWHTLIEWLDTANNEPMSTTAGQVFHGGRFPKKDPDKKQQLTGIFAEAKQLKTDASTIEKNIKKALSYQLAKQGIEAIRVKIALAKQQARVMNYDDLIHQLANSLTAETPLAELIRKQYPVALVDEFQDTDPQQYDILSAIYQSDQSAETALFMIGDPKQAIYAFRSGDVFTYLSAKKDADYLWVMNTNWRSSSAMVGAYNRLFYGAPLSTPAESVDAVFGFDIQYNPVNASGQADKAPLQSAHVDNASALQLIYFPFNENYAPKRSKKEEMNESFRPVIATWCSSEVHALLTSQTTIGDADLQEQDIAILVRDKREAAYIQDALRVAGYPSVYLSTHDNVFLSEEAEELVLALYAILELENDRAFVAGLSTRFMGCDVVELATLQEDEAQWEVHRDRITDLRDTWLKRGFMAMALKLLHQNFTPNPKHHERSLTNAIQLLELLQQASQRHNQPEQLIKWFRDQIEEQGLGAESELRLESDANLIRIITQHGCKGLEYPVVFIPFATRYKDPAKFGSKNIDLYKYHDRDTQVLNYFIGQDKTITELYKEESWAESIRLLYVAITRAVHRCYLCVTPFSNAHLSPLGQTLKLSDGDSLLPALLGLVETSDKQIYLQTVNETEFPMARQVKAEYVDEVSAASFTGRIERNWWLSSFSALTRNLRQGGVSTPDRDLNDELDDVQSHITPIDEIRFTLQKGAATGNLLHDILEHTDFSQPQWQRCIERPLLRYSETLDETQQAELIEWLTVCLNAPLIQCESANSNSSPKLNELTWTNTLRETEFYFPMEKVTLAGLGHLLSQHRNQQALLSVTNTSPKVSAVQLPGFQKLQGMMHGFIDLIFQWQGKYYIADYKSNFLGDKYESYDQNSMKKNIRENYYDLQYLLYSLALHRYLKNRISGYDPDTHFGGVYYLYLRGMSDESHHGVFHAAIDAQLLMEMDALFAGKAECTLVEVQNV